MLILLGCTREPIDLGPEPGPRPDIAAFDVAMSAGAQDWEVGHTLKKGRGCAAADLDLDGDPDLVLANPRDISYVLINESTPGRTRFEPGPILHENALAWGISAADIDGDGDLDLFVASGGLEGREFDRLLRNDLVETGTLAFTDVTLDAGVLGPWRPTEPIIQIRTASLEGQWLDYDLDGDLDLWVDSTHFPATWTLPPPDTILGQNQLWQNVGDGTFIDVAVPAGLGRRASSRFSSWIDIDGDGDLDLYENAMTPSTSALYRNDDGVFVDVTDGWAFDDGDISMPPETFVSATADLNNDGWDDLVKFVRGWPSDGPYLLGHTVLINAQGRGFVDATAESNLNDPFLSGLRDHAANGVMGATLRDLNGDGIPDVILGNGGPTAGTENALYLSVGLSEFELGSSGVQRVPVYENRSDLIAGPAPEDPASGLAWPPYPYRTHALCVADFDGDATPDLYVMNGGMSLVGGDIVAEPNQLFRFELNPKPRYLEVALHGDGISVPYTPVGTRIVVTASQGRSRFVVHETLRTLEGFEAQHGDVRWIGLGRADRIDSVEIRWTDGTREQHTDIALDTRVELWR